MGGDEEEHAGGKHQGAKADCDEHRPTQLPGFFVGGFEGLNAIDDVGVEQAGAAPAFETCLPGLGHNASEWAEF